MRTRPLPLMLLALLSRSGAALAGGDAPHLDGATLGLAWVAPFAGILLSIAILPLAAPAFWHHHYGKVSAFWSLALLVPAMARFGPATTAYELLHTALAEYLPFTLLLFTLYTVAGGIHVKGNLRGSPALNTGLLATGTLMASFTGTTGASMVLIRPLIRANDNRAYKVHVVVFFIFLVANIGGSLTPLGDPPLFLGFLKGVGFFWPTLHLFLPTLLVAGIVLVTFYVLDRYHWRREPFIPLRRDPTPASPVGIEGWINLCLLAAVVGAVLLSGLWKPGVRFTVYHVGVELQNLVRDVLLLAIAGISWHWTPARYRHANGFLWSPMAEVAKLFAGIFITIIPAIAILRAGAEGVLAPVVALVSHADGTPNNAAYFWVTGLLSSFLDNAPTYLVFFNTAGGDPALLTGELATTLTAISAGAVFMGANTYIGNAPNFMVKAIAEHRQVKMPGFFGYMGWSCCFLLPAFALTTLAFFR